MNRRLARSGLLAALTLGLAACAAAPVHYHTLLAPSVPAAVEPAAPFLIEVLPVGIPAQLDQAQLVVRQGDSSLALLEGERWAGPLDEELRTALSAELTRRLGTQDIAGLPRSAGKPLVRIKLQVRRLDAWPGRRVQLDADWGLGMANDAGNARLDCRGSFDEAAPGGYPELVQAQQRAVASLAARIASDARRWAAARGAGCTDAG